MTQGGRSRGVAAAIAIAALLIAAGCDRGERPGPPGSGDSTGSGGTADVTPSRQVIFTVPGGATFDEITDTLTTRGLVDHPRLFRLYARVRGLDTEVRSGEYAVRPGLSWGELMDGLVVGRVRTVAMTVPEGFTLPQIAERIAPVVGLESDSVLQRLRDDSLANRLAVPGPGLEGYLFPDTYRFASGVSIEEVVAAMAAEHEALWTPEWEARRDSLGMSRNEVVTLASIIQAEARVEAEMPTISSVYHNRLRAGWLLQADPTVQYALGGRRERLLYAAIDSVAEHPYNTYHRPGLPPGPIGSPGRLAVEAALYPAETEMMFFVARPDGSHVFTRTLGEHNRAKAASRAELDRIRRENAQSGR